MLTTDFLVPIINAAKPYARTVGEYYGSRAPERLKSVLAPVLRSIGWVARWLGGWLIVSGRKWIPAGEIEDSRVKLWGKEVGDELLSIATCGKYGTPQFFDLSVYVPVGQDPKLMRDLVASLREYAEDHLALVRKHAEWDPASQRPLYVLHGSSRPSASNSNAADGVRTGTPNAENGSTGATRSGDAHLLRIRAVADLTRPADAFPEYDITPGRDSTSEQWRPTIAPERVHGFLTVRKLGGIGGCVRATDDLLASRPLVLVGPDQRAFRVGRCPEDEVTIGGLRGTLRWTAADPSNSDGSTSSPGARNEADSRAWKWKEDRHPGHSPVERVCGRNGEVTFFGEDGQVLGRATRLDYPVHPDEVRTFAGAVKDSRFYNAGLDRPRHSANEDTVGRSPRTPFIYQVDVEKARRKGGFLVELFLAIFCTGAYLDSVEGGSLISQEHIDEIRHAWPGALKKPKAFAETLKHNKILENLNSPVALPTRLTIFCSTGLVPIAKRALDQLDDLSGVAKACVLEEPSFLERAANAKAVRRESLCVALPELEFREVTRDPEMEMPGIAGTGIQIVKSFASFEEGDTRTGRKLGDVVIGLADNGSAGVAERVAVYDGEPELRFTVGAKAWHDLRMAALEERWGEVRVIVQHQPEGHGRPAVLVDAAWDKLHDFDIDIRLEST